MDFPTLANQFQYEHARLLLESFQRWLGRFLLPQNESVCEACRLFEAPFVVVSHDASSDPIFNYGNLAALALFEMTWRDFTALPSRLSAEPIDRNERARLLKAVTEKNYIDDYSGIRISSTGKRFHIPRAIVWNVVDADGVYRGQAATFSQWRMLDETVLTSRPS